ncbi:MAG: hypothetical protein JWP25_4673 [Bradyrhizobium sp.]|nr:hypothetical protein [Bradyrhizobium sp.]
MLTTIAEFIVDGVFFATGFALCWFFKPSIQKMVIGANALSAKLHAQADAIAAAVKPKA